MAASDYFRGLLPTVSPDLDDKAWWDACNRGELTVPTCAKCGTTRFPMSPICPKCYAPGMQLIPVSGFARIFSFTIQYNPPMPALAAVCPYNIVIVELEDEAGTRMVSNVIDAAPEELVIGARVALVWQRDAAGRSLPRFRLCR